jgi:redox-sensing transcriptional repressor
MRWYKNRTGWTGREKGDACRTDPEAKKSGPHRGSMPEQDIPEVVVERLPRYVRALTALLHDDVGVVNSRMLGERLGVTPAQIRKDLSHFGRFGTQGRGYQVADLLTRLRSIIGLDQRWRACVVGVGRLGSALVAYRGFRENGIDIVAAFDNDPEIVGQTIGSLRVQPVDSLEVDIEALGVEIAVLAVPPAAAQQLADRIVGAGVGAIVNYAPVGLQVPRSVIVRQIDPVMTMQTITFYLNRMGA